MRRGPGALVRLPSAAGEVHCLVTLYPVLRDSTRSSLRRVSLYAPGGQVASAASGGIYDWARRVWADEERGFTLVELTAPAVQALLAARSTSRAVATAEEGMRATRVYHSVGGALAENSATIASVGEETIKLSGMIREIVLLVGEDGSLLAVTSGDYYDTLYTFEQIVREFLEERMWQIRCQLCCPFTSRFSSLPSNHSQVSILLRPIRGFE